jgi:hypothetical protein
MGMSFACHRITPVSKVTVFFSIMMSAAAWKSNGKYPYPGGGESSINCNRITIRKNHGFKSHPTKGTLAFQAELLMFVLMFA